MGDGAEYPGQGCPPLDHMPFFAFSISSHPRALSAESTQEEASELKQKAKAVWVTPLVTLEKQVRRIPSELRENGF